MRQLDICQAEYSAGSTRPAQVSEKSPTLGRCAYCFFMLAQRSMYHTAIEEDSGSIGDIVEDLQGVFKFIVVIVAKSLHPCFNFLFRVSGLDLDSVRCLCSRTCFKDISCQCC